ncbi:Major Facilitator Superfamily protein [Corynebacterium faecale]|nr:Major Facilitator Superfamily protein [Corynebacterium faecale]
MVTFMTTQPAQATAHPARRKVIAGLMFAQIMIGLSNGITLSMGSLLAASMAGVAWGGSAATLTTIGAALWAVPLAKMVTRYDRRTSLSTGMLLGSLGAVLAVIGAQFGLFPVVLLAFVFLGAMSAVNLQARFVATDVSGEVTRGRDLSLVVWATTIGAIIGPNLFTPSARFSAMVGLEQHAGAYVLCLIGQLIAIGVWVFTLPKGLKPGAIEAPDNTPATLTPMARRAITSVAVAHFSMVGIMSMTAVHMQGHGASLTIIGFTISLHVAGMYALSPLFGILTDRVGRGVTIGTGFAMLATSALLLVIWPEPQWSVIASLVLLGLGWNSALVGSSAMLNDATPTHHRAYAQGRSDLTMNLAGATGGLLGGIIVGATGMQYLAALVLIVVLVQSFLTRPKNTYL